MIIKKKEKIIDKLDALLRDNYLNFKHNDKTNVKLIAFRDKICFRGHTTKIQKDDDLLGSDIILNGIKDPKNMNDATNKNYVDSRSWKMPVICATIQDIKLFGLQNIDNVPLKDGDRILVKNQELSWQNGIYLVGQDKWIRSDDMANYYDVLGACLLVLKGDTNKETMWMVSCKEAIVGGSPLIFIKLNDNFENNNENSKNSENSKEPISLTGKIPGPLDITGPMIINGLITMKGTIELTGNIKTELIESKSVVSKYLVTDKFNVLSKASVNNIDITGTLKISENISICSDLFSITNSVSINDSEMHILSKNTIIDSENIIIGNELSNVSIIGKEIKIFNVPYYTEKTNACYFNGTEIVKDMKISNVKIGTYIVTIFIEHVDDAFNAIILGTIDGIIKKIHIKSNNSCTISIMIKNNNTQDILFGYSGVQSIPSILGIQSISTEQDTKYSDKLGILFKENTLRTMYLNRIC
jgi:hypothetical protein